MTAPTRVPAKRAAGDAIDVVLPVAALADALVRVRSVIKGRTTLPILSAVLLIAEPETDTHAARVTLHATDVERTVRTTVDGMHGDEVAVSAPVRVAMPAETLAATIAHTDADTLRLVVPMGGHTAGHATVIVGRARYRVPLVNPDDMPELREVPAPGHYGVSAGAILRAVKRVAYAASAEESRPHLHGLHFHANGEGTAVVAADGRRAAVVQLPMSLAGVDGALVRRLAAEVLATVFDGDELLAFQLERRTLVIRSRLREFRTALIEGEFPAWRFLLRPSSPVVAEFDRSELVSGIRQVAFLAESDFLICGLTFHRTIGSDDAYEVELRTSTPDQGAATARVSCRVTGLEADSAPFTIGVGAGFLRDAVTKTHHSVSVTVAMAKVSDALLVTDPADDSAIAIVMPLTPPAAETAR